jgi:hypothetical protein
MTSKVNLNIWWCDRGEFHVLRYLCSHVIASCVYCNVNCVLILTQFTLWTTSLKFTGTKLILLEVKIIGLYFWVQHLDLIVTSEDIITFDRI